MGATPIRFEVIPWVQDEDHDRRPKWGEGHYGDKSPDHIQHPLCKPCHAFVVVPADVIAEHSLEEDGCGPQEVRVGRLGDDQKPIEEFRVTAEKRLSSMIG